MRALLIPILLAVSACTALREGEILKLGDKDNESVKAFGFFPNNGLATALKIDDLVIDLHKAPPFIIVLPDGHRARSSEITASLLNRHSLPVVTEGGLPVATWREQDTLGWYVGRHWYAMFIIGEGDIAKSIHLSACGHEKTGVFESNDGKNKYGFPITKDQLQELFRLPASTSKIEIIWAFSCL